MKIHTEFYSFSFNFNRVEIQEGDKITITTIQEIYPRNWEFTYDGMYYNVYCNNHTVVVSQQKIVNIGWYHGQGCDPL